MQMKNLVLRLIMLNILLLSGLTNLSSQSNFEFRKIESLPRNFEELKKLESVEVGKKFTYEYLNPIRNNNDPDGAVNYSFVYGLYHVNGLDFLIYESTDGHMRSVYISLWNPASYTYRPTLRLAEYYGKQDFLALTDSTVLVNSMVSGLYHNYIVQEVFKLDSLFTLLTPNYYPDLMLGVDEDEIVEFPL